MEPNDFDDGPAMTERRRVNPEAFLVERNEMVARVLTSIAENVIELRDELLRPEFIYLDDPLASGAFVTLAGRVHAVGQFFMAQFEVTRSLGRGESTAALFAQELSQLDGDLSGLSGAESEDDGAESED